MRLAVDASARPTYKLALDNKIRSDQPGCTCTDSASSFRKELMQWIAKALRSLAQVMTTHL